ncbi:MAG TPA: hypothetical protein ENN41_09325 [Sediminispirochaeta sp.]|nr:hypothetical protein [Sediminispirochaeta sp.]
MTTDPIEIIAVGNPIIDIYAGIDEQGFSCLKKTAPDFEWGQVRHVDDELFAELLSCVDPEDIVPGGGAYNALRILAQRGFRTGFVGALGGGAASTADDTAPSAVGGMSFGPELFREEMRHFGIVDLTATVSGRPTGRSLCLRDTAGGAESLLIFNPAAATELGAISEDASGTLKPRLIYLEGFVLPRTALVEDILAWRGRVGAKLAVDLGASPIVGARRDFLLEELLPRTSFLFGTKEELEAFGLMYDELLHRMNRGVLVCKKGPDGSSVLFGESRIDVPARAVSVLDTTGAGDAYAAFFLTEYLRGRTVEQAAESAAYGSSLVLRQYGGRIPEH